MDERVKKLWLDALRSGKYKQGHRRLRTDFPFMQYCCLGVLCDLAVKENVVRWWLSDGGERPPGIAEPNAAYLTVEVAAWAGLHDRNPVIHDLDETLAGLNDTGCTFEQIADAIEEAL